MQKHDMMEAEREEAFRIILGTMGKNKMPLKRGKTFPVLMSVAAVAVLGAVLWYSYPKEKTYQEEAAVPLVRADAGPMKTVPNDPGGMDIPYRDSTVFETLRQARADGQGGDDGQVENLLANSDTEQPMTHEQVFAGVNTTMQQGADVSAIVKPDAVAAQGGVDAPSDIAANSAANASSEEVAQEEADSFTVASAPETDSEEIAVPMPAKKPTVSEAQRMERTEPAAGAEAAPVIAAAKDGYLIQIASVRSEGAAKAMWQELKQKYPQQLGALALNIDRADLGTRGVYYRVQGGVVTEARARQICSVLDSKRAGGCFVIRNR